MNRVTPTAPRISAETVHGNTVTKPDVDAFRKHVLDAFVKSDFSKNWPKGLLDRIGAA